MMGLAAAAFNWSAAQFWASTAHEYWAAYEIWREMNHSSDDGPK